MTSRILFIEQDKGQRGGGTGGGGRGRRRRRRSKMID
jgi:hypothetical protein